MFGNISGKKFDTYERDLPKYDRENFILDYFSTDWKEFNQIVFR